MTEPIRLTTTQVAFFAANGFIELTSVVPDYLNRDFLNAMNADDRREDESPAKLARLSQLGRLIVESDLPAVPAGTPLYDALEDGTALGDIVRLPRVRGAIESLVGSQCLLDHHFVHVANGPRAYGDNPQISQHLHQDSTIDPRTFTFDIQLFYFPHEVTEEMGGTRFIPGTHLRIVSESAVARYQNILGQRHIACPAGTIYFMHHGIWHGGEVNRTNLTRFLYKLRLNPTEPQVRLWDTTDLGDTQHQQRPIFFVKKRPDPDDVASILTRPLPWFENDTGRIEYIQRIRFWRKLIGDQSFDADYWATRLECDPCSFEA